MKLIVTKKGGLSIKGVLNQVDIPEGGELPARILAEQYPFSTKEFTEALIFSGFISDTEAPEEAPEKTKAELLEELTGLGVEVTKDIAKLKKAEIEALVDETKAKLSAEAELIENPEDGEPTGENAEGNPVQ